MTDPVCTCPDTGCEIHAYLYNNKGDDTPEAQMQRAKNEPDADGIYPDCLPTCDVRGGAIHDPRCPHA